MDRERWYTLFREVRTPVLDTNLFPSGHGQRAAIALLMAKNERKDAWRRVMEERSNARKGQN